MRQTAKNLSDALQYAPMDTHAVLESIHPVPRFCSMAVLFCLLLLLIIIDYYYLFFFLFFIILLLFYHFYF